MAKVNIEACGISVVINTNPEKAKEKSSDVSDVVKKILADTLRKEGRQGGLLYKGRGDL